MSAPSYEEYCFAAPVLQSQAIATSNEIYLERGQLLACYDQCSIVLFLGMDVRLSIFATGQSALRFATRL